MSYKHFYIFGDNIRGNFGEVDKPLNNTEIVDLLNELNDENKELKKENEQLRHEIEIEKKWQLEKDSYYVKIKEENEQLKQKLENLDLNEKNDTVKMIDGKVFIKM